MRSSCMCVLLCIPKLCSCFTLELGAVHASSHKNLQQFYCCVVPPVVAHFKKTQAKGNVPGATSGAFLLVRRRRRRCCADVVALRSSCMWVSASYSQVVQLHLGVGSCACILPQKSTVLLLCSPTCTYCCSPLLKNAKPFRLDF